MPDAAIATFLMTDIEGSSRLWEGHPDVMPALLTDHDAALWGAVERHGGTVVKTTGDGILARFEDPVAALVCALDGQRGLEARPDDKQPRIRARMALHTGMAQSRDGDYFGAALNRVARLLAIGHGGQVLVSGVSAALLRDRMPHSVELLDLGDHRLRDLEIVEHVFQLVADGLPRTHPALRSLGSSQTNLPSQPTSFVGRERELADVGRLLIASRLVTLTGAGGTGKTRLMLQAAAATIDRYRGGVWLAELAPVRDPGLLAQTVAAALGVREQTGVPAIDALVDYLRHKELLLLLDNCEHVIDAAAELVHRLLAGCPTLTIATTSREALGIPGESIFQVPSLSIPQGRERFDVHGDGSAPTLDEIASADAVRLFTDRASAVLPSFTVTADNAAAVLEICRRLDGIALAIELAAARVTLLSVDEIVQRLGDRFRLLTGGRRMAVPRQQTLQALIDWSWDLLEQPDRHLLARLSVFAGGWSLEAALGVCAEPEEDASDVLDALGRLVERSLVVVDHGAATRYRLLETIRQYARDRLVESGEAESVQARHLEHYLAIAERAAPLLRGPDMGEWIGRLGSDADNLRTAIEWGLDADPERAARLAIALTFYWQARATWIESAGWLSEAANRLRAIAPEDLDAARRRDGLLAVLMAESAFAVSSYLGGDTHLLAEEAVALARTTGNDRTLLDVLTAASTAMVFSGAIDRIDFVEVQRLARELDSPFDLAMLESGYANYLALENSSAADAILETAMANARRTGNPFVIGFTALGRARILSRTGRLAEAVTLFDEAFAAFADLPDTYFPLMARSELAHVMRLGDRLDEAEALYRETIHGWERVGNRGAIANQIECFGYLASARADGERAARLLGAAEALREAASAQMMPWERRDLDAAVGRLRGALEPEALRAAWSAGRAMDAEAAVAFALQREP